MLPLNCSFPQPQKKKNPLNHLVKLFPILSSPIANQSSPSISDVIANLRAMGFTSTDKIVKALQQCNQDVNATVELLLLDEQSRTIQSSKDPLKDSPKEPPSIPISSPPLLLSDLLDTSTSFPIASTRLEFPPSISSIAVPLESKEIPSLHSSLFPSSEAISATPLRLRKEEILSLYQQQQKPSSSKASLLQSSTSSSSIVPSTSSSFIPSSGGFPSSSGFQSSSLGLPSSSGPSISWTPSSIHPLSQGPDFQSGSFQVHSKSANPFTALAQISKGDILNEDILDTTNATAAVAATVSSSTATVVESTNDTVFPSKTVVSPLTTFPSLDPNRELFANLNPLYKQQ